MGGLDLWQADGGGATARVQTATLSVAVGGLLFVAIWLLTTRDRQLRLALPVTALVAGALIGLAAFWLPRPAVEPALAVVGAVGYFAAAPFFLLPAQRERRDEDLAFAAACLLLGGANAYLSWRPIGPACPWLCHGIRLGGYCVLASSALRRELEVRLARRAAELEAERSAREQFVAGLAHDLRSPISVASITTQLLDSEVGDEGQHRALGRIARSLARVNRMIEDFLDASLISAGHPLPLQLGSCDLVAIAREVIDEHSASHGKRFVLDAPPELSGYWWAKGLRRLIDNLVGNAVKYGDPDAAVTITIRARKRRVVLSVHNWGNPLPLEEQRDIFMPYRRSRSAQESGRAGWGIGLALVRGTAEAHGGSVTVRSDARAGTTFSVEVPRVARQSLRPAPRSAPGGPSRPAASSAS
jgi:signal transduction histidine kinase